MKGLSTCLWFDGRAEEAAKFYTTLFKGKILRTAYYPMEVNTRHAGSVMTVEFEMLGQKFLALDGGPEFKFNESVSLTVNCENQEEIDFYWKKLTEGGEEGPCGWLKDRFGLSWQVVPTVLSDMMVDSKHSGHVMEAFMKMKKYDIETLKHAYQG